MQQRPINSNFLWPAIVGLVLLLASGTVYAQDRDQDGVLDTVDNCPDTPNADQRDSGGLGTFVPNGRGDGCECGDVNNDGLVHLNDATIIQRSLAELGPGMAAPEKCNVQGSDDCDIEDWLTIHRALLGLAPGIQQLCVTPIDPNDPNDPNQPACIPDDEVCDGVDNDCDDLVDEELGETSCGIGICAKSVDNCQDGQPQLCDPNAGAVTEVCSNDLDDDCNGVVDDPPLCQVVSCIVGEVCETGLEGVCANGLTTCPDGPFGDSICAATNPEIETCDGIDNDCDGEIDDELGQSSCGIGACFRTVDNCLFGELQTCEAGAPLPELCENQIDDDCNGEVDDVALCAGNLPPNILSTPPVTGFENRIYDYPVLAEDPEQAALFYTLGAGPAGMSMSSEGKVSWVPREGQLGNHNVEVRVTDAAGQASKQIYSINVGTTNDPPIITSFPQPYAKVGELYTYDVEAFDPEQDPLTYLFDANTPTGMTIDPNSGLVVWTPPTGAVGPVTLILRVQDPNGLNARQSFDLTIIDDPLSLLSPSGAFQVNVGDELQLPVSSNYADAILGVDPLPSNADLNSGLFAFTPDPNQVGFHTLAFSARFANENVSTLVTVEVLKDNQPPIFDPAGSPTVDEGQELNFAVSATDTDGDPLRFSAPGLALENSFFNEITRVFTFRPSFDQSGSVDVDFEVSDGTVMVPLTVTILINDVTPPAEVLELVVDETVSPTFRTRQTISGNVTGEPGQPAAPEIPAFITGLSPATGRQGRTVEVDLNALNTAFEAGKSVPDFGPGTEVTDFEILSPTSAHATVQIDEDAEVGQRQVKMVEADGEIYSAVAFNVTEGAASVAGKVIDPFTQAPLAGVLITINGTNISTTTGADGSFFLDGVPDGIQTLLVMAPNFKVNKIEIAVDTNQEISLGDEISLRALARPAAPAGSLPAEPSPASVLDRGFSAKDGGGLDLDQAIELVRDVYLTVGGNDVGLLDEDGNQLNPNIVGEGILSLTPKGLEAQARALIGGDVYTLRDIVWMLTNIFSFFGEDLVLENAILGWQEAVNVAWAEPENPLNAMALTLFNDGTQVSVEPPLLSPNTRLNRVQAALLLQSFLVFNQTTIEQSIDEIIIDQGVDPNSVVAGAPRSLESRSQFYAAIDSLVEDFIGTGVAHAQEGGITLNNAGGVDNPFRARTFTRIMSYSGKAFLAEVTIGNAIGAAIAVAMQVALAASAGATGGALGAVAATAAVTALLGGVMDAIIQKLLFGLGLAAAAQSVEPPPPIPESSRIEGDKFILVFSPSGAESAPPFSPGIPDEWVRFTYQLFEFNNPETLNIGNATLVNFATLEQSLDNPGKLQFVIPVARLRIGVHFFRIATVQYVSQAEFSLNAARIAFPFESQLGVNTSIPDTVSDSTIVKFKFDLTESEAALIEMRARADFQRDFQVDFDEAIHQSRYEMDALGAAESRHRSRSSTDLAGFRNEHAQGIREADQLKRLAIEHGASGSDPFDLVRVESDANGRARDILGDPLRTLPPGVETNLTGIALETKNAEFQKTRINLAQDSLADIDQLKTDMQRLRNFGSTRTVEVQFDQIQPNGSVIPFDFDVNPSNPADLAIFDEFVNNTIELEKETIKDARPKLEAANTEVNRLSDDMVRERVGPEWDAEKARIKDSAEVQRSLERNRTNAQVDYQRAEVGMQNRRANSRNQQNVLVRNKKGIQRGAQVASAGANFIALKDVWNDFSKAFKVIYSDFSAVHMFTNFSRETAPIVIEAHPNLNNFRGILAGRKGTLVVDDDGQPVIDPATGEQLDERKQGWLTTLYPDAGEDFFEIRAGFPPEFLSVDPNDLIYANNFNSNQRYGGRNFRWFPGENFRREFAGSINYFSQMLLYARPANPITGAIGEFNLAGKDVPTYFIANIDFLDNNNNSGGAGRKQIKAIPVGAAEAFPNSYGTQFQRIRLVGQTLIESDLLDLSGPSDMEILPREEGSEIQRIYLSDKDKIWLITHNVSLGTGSLLALIIESGRQFSGMAFDEAGNFYFADFNSGDIFTITIDELRALEDVLADPPNAVPILSVNDSPFDIELDQERKKLVVSTRSGVQQFLLPVVVKKTNEIRAMKTVNFSKENDVLVRLDRNGNPHFVLDPTEFDHQRREIRARVQLSNVATGEDEWQAVVIPMEPVGLSRRELQLP